VSFTLPYKNFPDGQGSSFYSAILPVSIALPVKNAPRSKRFEACIDSGASSCLFHASIGRALGFVIEQGDAQETMGISGPSNIYMHDVALYAPGGVVLTRAGFSDDLPISGLLGMSGFFDHFKITFDPTARACTLDRIFSE